MAGAAILCIEVDPHRIERRLETRYLDEATESLDDALARIRAAAAEGRALSVGLLGNAAEIVPELAARGEHFDFVTDQTAAHDPLTGYVPVGLDVDEAAALRASDPDEYLRRARASIVAHVEGMLEYVRRGAYVFDYGNNLRGEARDGGVAEAFSYPGFVPAYIRPLFCRGIGPFRWAALSGDPADIATIDAALRELFPDDPLLQRWLELAPERVAFQGLPARICWLGYGDRAKAGLAMNELVRSGAVKAPIVIGRDHLDAGSVASPYRETEAMRDGSDAIADWPILNALVNVAAGATWVSVHHGGGVGIGNSIHAGMVVVADGTDAAAERLERVLTTDPGTGVMRHVDAGYAEAIDAAARGGIKHPVRRRTTRDRRGCSSATSRSSRRLPGRSRAAARRARSARSRCSRTRTSSARATRSRRSGGCATCRPLDGDVVEVDGRGRCAIPGLVDCHTHAAFGGDRVEEFSLRAGGASYEELHARGGGILSTVRATRAAGEDGLRAAVERHRGLDAARTARRRSRGSRATGSTATPSSRRSARCATPAASRRGSARTPCRRSSRATPTRTSTSRSPRCCPRRRSSPRRPTSSSSAARSTPRRRAGTSRRAATAGLALRLHGDQFTESGRDPARDRARRALGRPSRGDRRRGRARARGERRRRRPAAGERALPRPADAARAGARRRRRRGRARDRLQPGQRVLREPAALLLARRDAAEALAGRGALGVHRQRGPRARSRRAGRPPGARATAPTSSCSTRRTGAISRTTSAADSSTRSCSQARASYADSMPTRKQRRRELKKKRHEYEFVYVDGEGNELEELPEGFEEPKKERPAARNGSKPAAQGAAAARRPRLGRTPPEPSWNRAFKRGGLLGVVVFVLFSFTAKGTLDERSAARGALHACSSFRSRS